MCMSMCLGQVESQAVGREGADAKRFAQRLRCVGRIYLLPQSIAIWTRMFPVYQLSIAV